MIGYVVYLGQFSLKSDWTLAIFTFLISILGGWLSTSLFSNKIIGGLIIFDNGISHYRLGSIFIDPEYHRKGIGTASINFLIDTYPNVKKWSLETPPWNIRTRSFYKRLGFKIVKESKEDVFFEKTI